MDRRTELSSFLKSRRARLRPDEVGLPVYGGERRVPGLRREELAQLAGVSTTHYTRLEQGQTANVSTGVLDAVSTALRLSVDEREYLHRLVHPPRTPPLTGLDQMPELRYMVDAVTGAPAYVTGRYGNLLAWNRMTAVTLFDFHSVAPAHRTWTHAVFLETELRTRFSEAGEWERTARHQIAYLRLCWSRFQNDPEITAAVEDLTYRSEDFRRLWAEQLVTGWTGERVRLHHPLVGPLDITQALMHPHDDLSLTFVIGGAAPGSPTGTALRKLAAAPADAR
ncbi:helix-turn-helix transcriptional regulator [Streptomyces sp. NPDC050095]|uniref:helix-turn-helix domain-containing protein n=1 Tax=unclassified Streptomyces TaxID=2593676 RepID=UPI0034256615